MFFFSHCEWVPILRQKNQYKTNNKWISPKKGNLHFKELVNPFLQCFTPAGNADPCSNTLHLYDFDVWWSGVCAFCSLPSLCVKPSHHPFLAASRSSTFGSVTVAWNSAYWSELINMKSRIHHFPPPVLPLYPPHNLPSQPLSFINSPFPWIIPHFSLLSHQTPGFHFDIFLSFAPKSSWISKY